MTDFPGENAYTSAGAAITERSGAASGDTVPVGCVLLMRNTGAGSHDVTFTNNLLTDGLTTQARTITMPAAAVKAVLIPPYLGDANGRVAMAVANATPTELKYYIMSGF